MRIYVHDATRLHSWIDYESMDQDVVVKGLVKYRCELCGKEQNVEFNSRISREATLGHDVPNEWLRRLLRSKSPECLCTRKRFVLGAGFQRKYRGTRL